MLRAEGLSVAAVGDPSLVYTARQAQSVLTAEEALRVVEDSGGQTVAVEGGTLAAGKPATVSGVESSAGAWRARVDGETASTVVFADSYADAWRATVDGKYVVVHPANVILMAVEVPPGIHTVELRYQPRGFGASVLASVLAAMVLVAMAVVPGLPRRGAAGAGKIARI